MAIPKHVLIAPIGQSLEQVLQNTSFSKLFVLTDENTAAHCYPLISSILPAEHLHFSVPAGEEHKTLQTCSSIWSQMTSAGLDRQALVINLGGGVITDMGGFCAATYKRGVRFINIPTTLLSQVDASVGGKLGVDFEGYKNHIGLFGEPEAVLADPVFLKTLSPRELRSGYAEVVKHALIADAGYWQKLLEQEQWQELDWQNIISHSIGVKGDVVLQDPTEKGLRKILNFGHTLGHALESYRLEGSAEQRLLHGEAIAAGMICEAWLSAQKCGLSEESLKEIARYISSVWPETMAKPEDIPAILGRLEQDKKNEGKQVLFSLLKAPGESVYNIAVQQAEARQALAWYIKKGWQ
ncbi:3-dehydroquinate synthase [Cesiribacter sp. SM1]|uniref:3-dehydroquinate synthase n=1 Tax=Cesiribacter sp. SM1 TaxID=2861196 RepID=UPI001CD6DEA7|nr:3-dehydroquinate synthase [Cesiribacter sp. SM1]